MTKIYDFNCERDRRLPSLEAFADGLIALEQARELYLTGEPIADIKARIRDFLELLDRTGSLAG